MAISSTTPTQQDRPTNTLRQELLASVLVLIIAAAVYAQFGFQGALMRDNAIYLYSGQQMAQGVAPYQSIFDHKGPMSPILIGWAVMLANATGMDDILTARIFFYLMSCLTVTGMFLLGSRSFGSRRAGLLVAFVFLTMTAFGMHAAIGPRAKTPMVLFEVFALYFIGRRRWIPAAVAGTLAGLTWQPAGIFALIGLFFAWRWSSPGNKRKNLLLYIGAMTLPFLVVFVYFAAKGAFGDFVQGYFLFNFVYLARDPVMPTNHFRIIYTSIIKGYSPMGPVVFLGLATMVALFCVGLRSALSRAGKDERLAPVLWTFPFPVLFTLMDFQGPVDLFILLPYACLGAGLLLERILRRIGTMEGMNPRILNAIALATCISLIFLAGLKYRSISNDNLIAQREAAQRIEQTVPEDTEFVSIGVPEFFALTHRRNPDPYLFVMNGIDNYIDSQFPGGLEGWLESIRRNVKATIVYGGVSGPHADMISQWLEDNYEPAGTDGFLIYRRREESDNPAS